MLAAAPGAGEEAGGMMAAMMRSLPLRALVSFGGGAVTEETLDGLLAQLNGAGEAPGAARKESGET